MKNKKGKKHKKHKKQDGAKCKGKCKPKQNKNKTAAIEQTPGLLPTLKGWFKFLKPFILFLIEVWEWFRDWF